MTNRWAFLVIAILLIVVAVLLWMLFEEKKTVTAVGAPLPQVERPKEDASQTTGPLPLSAKVSVKTPEKNQIVSSTFAVNGVAPGPWFFEGSFPIQVRDKSGNVVGRAVAQAEGEWMTEGLVTFSAAVSVSNYTGPAVLILLRDNPSGLPENDDALEIPLTIR
ncbi:MAG: hypothetical protein RIQ56_888 [Candidatus Parcubacteria bacterium]|jgi:hypothetical protein